MTNRKSFARHCSRWLLAGALISGSASFVACSDYDLDETTPEGWGESIYSYLEQKGNYTMTVRLINDLNQWEVLAKTGSKTFFAADDAAFERFFQNNPWGVRSYADLSQAQKKMLLNGAMVNNSLQVNNLSSTEGPTEGECMRRKTATSEYDTVPFLKPADMPDNPYWKRYADQGGILCMEDMTPAPMIHFIEKQLLNQRITNDDYSFIYNKAVSRQPGDASVNGVPIIEQNIKCSNGFIHRVGEVITPLPNMAEIIAGKSNTTIFNRLMVRFSAPYYIGDKARDDYRALTGQGNVDSVFQKRFFSKKSQDGMMLDVTPDRSKTFAETELLKYDPEWNTFYSGEGKATSMEVALQRDMGVMLVPSDAAMTDYWNNGAGVALKERYGTWDNVPDKTILKLLNNAMLESFTGSVPSKFNNIYNDANDPIGITTEHIDSVWLGCNGAIYLTNRVFSPTSYISVLFPAVVNSDGNMSVIHEAVESEQYTVYLNSLTSFYSFFVPNNNGLLEYIDPCSYGKTTTQLFRFRYDPNTASVRAVVWNYDTTTGQTVGDSLGYASSSQVSNRLRDILDTHIVIGDVEDGHEYYRTKGGTEIRVKNVSMRDHGMTVEGSYQVNEGQPLHVSEFFDQTLSGGNGRVYVLDEGPILGTRKTVRSILAEHEEFSEFLKLMDGSGIFETIHNDQYSCGGTNIADLNTYHYTVYVPTNESIRQLINSGKLPTWDAVELLDGQAKTRDSLKIVNFVKYHIQDNSVFIGGETVDVMAPTDGYETAVYDEAAGRFQKLYVKSTASGIDVVDRVNIGKSATERITRHVVTTNPDLYNLQAREYQYNSRDAQNASNIQTSSSAVVHLIDGPLMLE